MGRTNTGRVIGTKGGTVGATSVSLLTLGFSTDEVRRANYAWFTCATEPINYRYDGTPATASPTGGHLLPVGGGSEVDGSFKIADLNWIRAGADDGHVVVTLEE